jgi:hypothetical protein
MSSWNSGRLHFRERKMPNRPIVPEVSHPIQEPVQIIPTINTNPSKYVFSTKKLNDAVVCCIALNEEPYIDEWIKYHLALGFSHIYIYDNSLTNSLKNKKSNNVTVIHFPGSTKQLEAYNLCIVQYKNKHNWCAFIDCDEFIVLKKHTDIISFLNYFDKYNSIALNWLMFGTSNEKVYRDEPVTSRFRYCARKTNEHFKCICKLSSITMFINPHRPLELIYDTNGQPILDSVNYNGTLDIACIHHYYTKSEEEFLKKINRGRADISEKRSTEELLDIHSKNNDVFNSDAWDFYSKHL